jgi:uncharacterized protein (UPF0147 family)
MDVKGLTCTVNVTGIEQVGSLCEVLKAVITDERIPESVRLEYVDKVSAIFEKGGDK